MTDVRLREDSRPVSAATERTEVAATKGNQAGIAAGGMLVAQRTMQPTQSLKESKQGLQDKKEAPAKF